MTIDKYDWDALLKDIEFRYIGPNHIYSYQISASYIDFMFLGIHVWPNREDLEFLKYAPHRVKRSLMKYLESRVTFPYNDTDKFLKEKGVIQ